mmetsp:Transcript_9496/g.20940  ORF Transcript_9496/g.20940 Transcript_9496/m.20940 type:complete len:240 (+) Transcript_9496:88-807(+)
MTTLRGVQHTRTPPNSCTALPVPGLRARLTTHGRSETTPVTSPLHPPSAQTHKKPALPQCSTRNHLELAEKTSTNWWSSGVVLLMWPIGKYNDTNWPTSGKWVNPPTLARSCSGQTTLKYLGESGLKSLVTTWGTRWSSCSISFLLLGSTDTSTAIHAFVTMKGNKEGASSSRVVCALHRRAVTWSFIGGRWSPNRMVRLGPPVALPSPRLTPQASWIYSSTSMQYPREALLSSSSSSA